MEPYDDERIDRLGDPNAFRYCSGEELRSFLKPSPDWRVAEFGSGTGLFADEVAPVVGRLYAVDVRPGLHDRYRRRGMPGNVVPLVADFRELPLPDDFLDAGLSIRTYHHGMPDALGEVARVIRPGGRLVVVDWSADGAGDRRFRTDEDYLGPATVQSQLRAAGFEVVAARERRETFVVVGELG